MPRLEWTTPYPGRRSASAGEYAFIIDAVDGRAEVLVRHRGTDIDSFTSESIGPAREWCERWGESDEPAPEHDPWERVDPGQGAYTRTFEHIDYDGWQLRRLRMGWVLYSRMADGRWHQGAELGRNEKRAKERATEIVEKIETGKEVANA